MYQKEKLKKDSEIAEMIKKVPENDYDDPHYEEENMFEIATIFFCFHNK